MELKEYRTSENMGSFLAKSTTRVMAGVMILVNSLKASRSTLSPSEEGTMGPCPMSSDWKGESGLTVETLRGQVFPKTKQPVIEGWGAFRVDLCLDHRVARETPDLVKGHGATSIWGFTVGLTPSLLVRHFLPFGKATPAQPKR